ncbi:MAG: class I SAM-dependent methyltransferase [Acidimicrobiales bacterium]
MTPPRPDGRFTDGLTGPTSNSEVYEHPDDGRMAALRRVHANYLVVEDLYPGVARRFIDVGISRFLELGGGRGPIAALLGADGIETCVVDRDARMVSEMYRPGVRADITMLPLADDCVDGAAAVNCLYFVTDPRVALREAKRVLAPGSLFLASAPSRWNDPELEGVDPRWGAASTFDAEDAPALVADVFGSVEVERWRVPAYVLPDASAVADYFHAFDVRDWRDMTPTLEPPLTITKVGAHVWARA